jgi:phosphatidate phosphatase PAH1
MNKKRSISWCTLFDKIGKQPIHKTQHTKVQVLINGELKECALVFTDNGSNFHLEIVE